MGKTFKRGDRWGIAYTDHRGKRVRKMVAGDQRVAQKALGDAVQAVEKLKAGVLQADPREGKRAIQAQIDAYLGDLRRRGRDEMYIYVVKRHVENAAESQEWACLADCGTRSVSSYLSKLSKEDLSAKTLNAHRADLAAFFAWAVRNGVLEANPCDGVQKTTVKAVKTRRALSVVECQALLDAAPEDRRACYQFLLLTGLRRSEAAAIQWDHLHLNAANAYVELSPDLTKSGKAETVPLLPDVVRSLSARRGDAQDGDPVFHEIPSMADFRLDLAAAGIDEVDVRGRRVVLHSLRHSLATMLAASQVPMAVTQKIMRHRDIRLTSEVYLDEGLLPLSAAMASLPSLTGAN